MDENTGEKFETIETDVVNDARQPFMQYSCAPLNTKQPNDLCDLRRPRSACTSAQCDQVYAVRLHNIWTINIL